MTDHDKNPSRSMMTNSFPDRESAERAYNDLEARGFKSSEIHVLMADDTRKRLFVKDDQQTDLGNKALEGAGVGGAVGGAVGATVLGFAAAAAALTIPGLGLVIAGPLAGAIAGGAAGATAGGIVGMLVGAGIPEDRAKVYETELKNGSIVLGVTPRHDEDTKYFEREWTGQHLRH